MRGRGGGGQRIGEGQGRASGESEGKGEGRGGGGERGGKGRVVRGERAGMWSVVRQGVVGGEWRRSAVDPLIPRLSLCSGVDRSSTPPPALHDSPKTSLHLP